MLWALRQRPAWALGKALSSERLFPPSLDRTAVRERSLPHARPLSPPPRKNPVPRPQHYRPGGGDQAGHRPHRHRSSPRCESLPSGNPSAAPVTGGHRHHALSQSRSPASTLGGPNQIGGPGRGDPATDNKEYRGSVSGGGPGQPGPL